MSNPNGLRKGQLVYVVGGDIDYEGRIYLTWEDIKLEVQSGELEPNDNGEYNTVYMVRIESIGKIENEPKFEPLDILKANEER